MLRFLVVAFLALASTAKAQEPPKAVRVWVLGFICDKQTADDAFQRDGKDDEVFGLVQVAKGKDDKAKVIDTYRTKVHGDTYRQNDRFQCGSASDLGGIITGNWCPDPKPWTVKPEQKYPGFPFLVYDAHVDAEITINPMLIEWDNGDLLNNAAKVVRDEVKEEHGLIGIIKGIVGEAADRPIGTADDRTYTPQKISLDAKNVEEMLSVEHDGVKGIKIITLKDGGKLGGGEYRLFLLIEAVE